jgi:CubicO group peptidase (beta-lactamase class C family)
VNALAGTGYIRSTADDLLTYLGVNLHPDELASKASASSNARTLPKAIALSQEVRGDVEPGAHVAFAWILDDASGTYWHNGATGGYSSFVLFNPSENYAAVVLLNMSVGPQGNFAQRLGLHIGQRLAGLPVSSLAN